MINRVLVTGRWTRDLEMRYSQSGKEIANGNIAVDNAFKKDDPNFFNVVIFGKQALNAAEYTKKGSLVGIDGRLQSRSYEKDGRRVYVTEIIADSVTFLDSKTTKKEEDPFSSEGQQIDVDDPDGLPF